MSSSIQRNSESVSATSYRPISVALGIDVSESRYSRTPKIKALSWLPGDVEDEELLEELLLDELELKDELELLLDDEDGEVDEDELLDDEPDVLLEDDEPELLELLLDELELDDEDELLELLDEDELELLELELLLDEELALLELELLDEDELELEELLLLVEEELLEDEELDELLCSAAPMETVSVCHVGRLRPRMPLVLSARMVVFPAPSRSPVVLISRKLAFVSSSETKSSAAVWFVRLSLPSPQLPSAAVASLEALL